MHCLRPTVLYTDDDNQCDKLWLRPSPVYHTDGRLSWQHLRRSAVPEMWRATSRRQHQLHPTALSFAGVPVVPVKSVQNLGISIDADLSMRTYVQIMASRYFSALRQLRQICRHVPTVTVQMLVVRLVLSRLEFGNGLLVRSSLLLRRLQSALNASTRFIYR